MEKNNLTKKIAIMAILIAVAMALQFIANYVTLGPVSITLALIPIVIGAIIVGPLGGFIIGLCVGVAVIFAPSTLSLFYPINPFATILICLFKTALAGLGAGYLFKLISKKNEKVATIVASCIVPIINTLLFAIAVLIFYRSLLNGDKGIWYTLIISFIGFNFLIEFATNALLSNAVYVLIKYQKRQR